MPISKLLPFQINIPSEIHLTNGSIIPPVSLGVSVVILAISAWTLYLSHYKEYRSEVSLLSQSAGPEIDAFDAGSHALGQSARWSGHTNLKITNTGEKGAYISSISHELIELQNGNRNTQNTGIEFESKTRAISDGMEIDPHSTLKCRPSFTISPPEDIEIFVEHDTAVILSTIIVEDKKGAYEATQRTEMKLTGPGNVQEDYKSE